jgi:hypothetical protein
LIIAQFYSAGYSIMSGGSSDWHKTIADILGLLPMPFVILAFFLKARKKGFVLAGITFLTLFLSHFQWALINMWREDGIVMAGSYHVLNAVIILLLSTVILAISYTLVFQKKEIL